MRFLLALREGWSVSYAADRAGVVRSDVYQWRDASPDFARAWADAREAGTDALEDEAKRRAVDGWDEQTAWGVVRRYDGRLLDRLLRGRRRDVYGEVVPVQHGEYVSPLASPEWHALQERLVAALAAFPEARGAVVAALGPVHTNGEDPGKNAPK